MGVGATVDVFEADELVLFVVVGVGVKVGIAVGANERVGLGIEVGFVAEVDIVEGTAVGIGFGVFKTTFDVVPKTSLFLLPCVPCTSNTEALNKSNARLAIKTSPLLCQILNLISLKFVSILNIKKLLFVLFRISRSRQKFLARETE